MTQNKTVGKHYENKVSKYLRTKDFSIIDQNFFSPYGEIDIIAEKKERLHFIEVKFTLDNKINPIFKLNKSKQERMFKTAQYFISQNNISEIDMQFDFALVTNNKLIYYTNIITNNYN